MVIYGYACAVKLVAYVLLVPVENQHHHVYL